MRSEVEDALIEHLKYRESIIKNKIVKKLNNLYDRKILLKTDSDAYINLSHYILKDNDTKLLNLGINFHLQHKYSKIEKKADLELLFQNKILIKEHQQNF